MKFRRLRNEVISNIRLPKIDYFNNMALKLRSGNLGSRDWWKILKSFKSPTSSSGSTLPPIFESTNDRFAVDDYEKANVLNFCSQSEIDDSSITLPRDHPQFFGENINNITITPQEVFDVLQRHLIQMASITKYW